LERLERFDARNLSLSREEMARTARSGVPYSLRHTYATMRISEGASVFQLAANMGTSVEMLEDFYGKKRMRDPKMATEVTKNRSRMST
jgi:integrase